MASRTKVELSWIGKDNRPALESRALLEDPAKSHHAARVSPKGLSDNHVIFGDNVLALKAMQTEFAGKAKCVYIDPPFNTGEAFKHYDDAVEHSLWLTSMRERFELLRTLLRDDGVLVVHLDDSEAAYAKVLLDEVFGRANYLNTITMTTNAPSGFKATAARLFSTANYLLVYAKSKADGALSKVFIERDYDGAYNKLLCNKSASSSEWRWERLGEVVARERGFDSVRDARRALGDDFDMQVADAAIARAPDVFRTAAIGGGARAKRLRTIEQSRLDRGRVFVHPGDEGVGFFILGGEQILFYENRLVDIDGRACPGEVLTDVWTDLAWTGIAREGGVEFKNGKKPEALLRRILDMTTEPGDLVIDCFGGSGTTGAVAHKMGRRWLLIEVGEQCHTHLIPRLTKVIDGDDATGITNEVGWKGGGGFRYCSLAPSLPVPDAQHAPQSSPPVVDDRCEVGTDDSSVAIEQPPEASPVAQARDKSSDARELFLFDPRPPRGEDRS